ncbi:hypothetical protein PHMEG_00028248 [Phytophthora megakarya]|uniref:Cleavage induced protein n=1 Tax=Phytophthora megakarya TaxID=4795 RepID=A0A225V5D2_9STRA|nr:hypothetical protein PHMEG_00028248 [Phytophthora megakarya]
MIPTVHTLVQVSTVRCVHYDAWIRCRLPTPTGVCLSLPINLPLRLLDQVPTPPESILHKYAFYPISRSDLSYSHPPLSDYFVARRRQIHVPINLSTSLRCPLLLGIGRRWNDIVRHEVRPQWRASKPQLQGTRPTNHHIPVIHLDKVRKHIRKGQLERRYLALDKEVLDLWPEVFISPAGLVDKGETDKRVINDYSFPHGESVNDFTGTTDFPSISCNPPRDIATRIHDLRTKYPNVEVLIMLGDVSGAFRHVPDNELGVHAFAFLFDGYIVIDLACGGPRNRRDADQPPLRNFSSKTGVSPLDASTFTGNVWCDDHVCVEVNVNTGSRCNDAIIALRRAIVTVLGRNAMNEDKFTRWSTRAKALGLNFDTHLGTVSIPDNKLGRARLRADSLLARKTASKTELLKVLGVFRHVAVCFPSARAFYQRIQAFATRMPSLGRRYLNTEAIEDLRWFRAVLAHDARFNGIPVEQIAGPVAPVTHLYMDASDVGLCVINPARREYIRHRFTTMECASIRAGLDD